MILQFSFFAFPILLLEKNQECKNSQTKINNETRTRQTQIELNIFFLTSNTKLNEKNKIK